jgi:hypothetical protein
VLRYGSAAIAAPTVFLGTLGLLFDDIPREARPLCINDGCLGLA